MTDSPQVEVEGRRRSSPTFPTARRTSSGTTVDEPAEIPLRRHHFEQRRALGWVQRLAPVKHQVRLDSVALEMAYAIRPHREDLPDRGRAASRREPHHREAHLAVDVAR